MAAPAPATAPTLKTPDEIAIMREAGRIVARTHQAMREVVRPGVSTAELDAIAVEVLRKHNATPTFLNYPQANGPAYPATITASLNEELVHGIPSPKRILREGDIISLDVGCLFEGFVGDAAFSMGVGEIRPSVQRLLDVCEQALYVAIAAAVLPNTVRDIALATQTFVEKQGYTVARTYTGHGVGRKMHEPPDVPNWWPRSAERRGWVNEPLQAGMTLALEPMVIAGRPDTRELEDGWTVVTKDRSLCAHFEHSIAVTDGEPIILTLL